MAAPVLFADSARAHTLRRSDGAERSRDAVAGLLRPVRHKFQWRRSGGDCGRGGTAGCLGARMSVRDGRWRRREASMVTSLRP